MDVTDEMVEAGVEAMRLAQVSTDRAFANDEIDQDEADAIEVRAALSAALAAAWVPCAEREPELSTDVLTWDGESMDVDYLVGPDYWKHRPTGVTHWMPLPPPPDEKAGEP